MKTKRAASLVIHDATSMSKRGRAKIAKWLEDQAQFLRQNGDNLSKRFRAGYHLVLPLLVACVLVTGCRTPQTPEDQLKDLVADARDIGEVGTTIALLENKEFRDELEKTRDALVALEKLPDPITVAALVDALKTLPVKELQSPKAQLYLLAGKIVIRRAGVNYTLGSIGMRPIVQALREGMDDALTVAIP
jgi:hypothetical protein